MTGKARNQVMQYNSKKQKLSCMHVRKKHFLQCACSGTITQITPLFFYVLKEHEERERKMRVRVWVHERITCSLLCVEADTGSCNDSDDFYWKVFLYIYIYTVIQTKRNKLTDIVKIKDWPKYLSRLVFMSFVIRQPSDTVLTPSQKRPTQCCKSAKFILFV